MVDNIKYALGATRYMLEGGIYEIFSDKKYTSIYMFSTENVRGVVSSLDVSDKDILTVSASGDHIFNMLLMGLKMLKLMILISMLNIFIILKKQLLKH